MSKRILFVGDSHSKFWTGYNHMRAKESVFAGVDVLHVVGATAFNIGDEQSTAQVSAKLEALYREQGERYGCVVFCFGEIDCRVHAVKNAIKSSTSIADQVKSIVSRYFDFVQNFSNRYQVPCIFWGPIPTSPLDQMKFNPNFPTFGTCLERNYATFKFNEYLCRFAQNVSQIDHTSIFEDLVDEHYATKAEFLYDGVHLSNIALPLAEAALKQSLDRLGVLEELEPCLKRRWMIDDTPSELNVAENLDYIVSSTYKDSVGWQFADRPQGYLRFHTDLEDQPHIILPLGSGYFVKKIELHNRTDACSERAKTVAVALSYEGKEYFDVFAPDDPQVFGANAECLVIDISHDVPVRFVKLYLRERQYFHLEHVSIFVASFQQHQVN
ncbi:discoidin domain-containing protein [Pseudorhizobium marinum]|uniref:discoidin domain-containing protein n=1 Tax=Pseudorhizobium marinum TaxID=1496690 RepID=UPI000497A822|nr:discoidin domain-containing protein [Pseudorhizobium marinum]